MATIKSHLDKVSLKFRKLTKWAKEFGSSEDLSVVLNSLINRKILKLQEVLVVKSEIEKCLFEIADDMIALRDTKKKATALSQFKKDSKGISTALDKIAKTLQKDEVLSLIIDEVFQQGSFTPSEKFDPDEKSQKVSGEELKQLLEIDHPEVETERTKLINQSLKISECLKVVSQVITERNLQYYQLFGVEDTRARLIYAAKLTKQKARFMVAARLMLILKKNKITQKKAVKYFILEVGNLVLSDLDHRFDSSLGLKPFESEESVLELFESKGWKALFKN